jgi:serine/threonine protein kinase
LGTTIPLEIFILKRLSHPGIIQFLDFMEDQNFFYLITEFCGGPVSKLKLVSKCLVLPLTPPLEFENKPVPIDFDLQIGNLTSKHTVGASLNDIGIGSSKPDSKMPDSPSDKMGISLVETSIESETGDEYEEFEDKFGMLLRKRSSDLFDYIDTNTFSTEVKIRYIFKQIANSVFYLHSNNIVHRDIKDENVVIDNALNTKLIDFGAAELIPVYASDYFQTFRGTFLYTPPELLVNPIHRGPEADIWCLGTLLYALSFSKLPFSSLDDIAIQNYNAVRINRSALLMDLISKMLNADPKSRFTIEQVISHEWLSNKIAN